MKNVKLYFAAFLLVTSSWPSFTADIQNKKECHHDKPCRKIINELRLTPQQKEKLKALRKEQKDEQKALFEKMKKVRKEIKEELLKDLPDTARLSSLATQVGAIHEQIAQHHQKKLLQIKEILSKEQFEKLLKIEPVEYNILGRKHRCWSRDKKNGHCPLKEKANSEEE